MFIKIILDEFGFYNGTVRSWCESNDGVSPDPEMDLDQLGFTSYLEDGIWKSVGPQPGPNFTLDKVNKVWVDKTDLDSYKLKKWESIKLARDSLEFGGFNWNGYIFDSDPLSQGRLIGAAMLGTDIVWTLKDNSTVELTGTELTEVSLGLQQYVASLHERSRIARTSIESATTIDEVNSIIL